MAADNMPGEKPEASMVLYCLLRRKAKEGQPTQFLMIQKQGFPTFPPTKFRPGEDLYHALVRPMEEDLGLPAGSYFPEEELPMIPNAGESPRYPGLAKQWYLYPVVVSLTEAASAQLAKPAKHLQWSTLEEVISSAAEPNVMAIARYLRDKHPGLLADVPAGPSMDALACRWAAMSRGGVRVAKRSDITAILDAGSRAFNLRVADPYLPYQKQGLGFTWSFFTPKDKQDVHVHGLPAVEIYGVLEGRLQIWHKPMNQRGVRTWQCETLGAGDWAEVEPLHCHFACWLDKEGLGTVIKAAAGGELAGVGRIGEKGKTTCRDCSMRKCSIEGSGTQDGTPLHWCQMPPAMTGLVEEYDKPFEQRDYARIAGQTTKPFRLSVKAVIQDKEGRCLLLKRSRLCKNNAGKWDLPGGKVDPGEAIDAALVREVAEECGVVISVDRVLGAAESDTPTKKVVYVIFGGRHVSGEVRLSEEHDGYKWVSREDLAKADLCTQFRPFAEGYCPSREAPS